MVLLKHGSLPTQWLRRLKQLPTLCSPNDKSVFLNWIIMLREREPYIYHFYQFSIPTIRAKRSKISHRWENIKRLNEKKAKCFIVCKLLDLYDE